MHEVFQPVRDDSGDMYRVGCPECGDLNITFEVVGVYQNDILTIVENGNDRVEQNEDGAFIPHAGAWVSINCHCGKGHQFGIGLRHADEEYGGEARVCVAGSADTADTDRLPSLWKPDGSR